MKAYPYMHKHPTSGQTTISEGMDLRDYFAAKVLQAQLSIPKTAIAISSNQITTQDICGYCYEWADLMMKQRKEVPNE
jgi:hypothetical protein